MASQWMRRVVRILEPFSAEVAFSSQFQMRSWYMSTGKTFLNCLCRFELDLRFIAVCV